MSSNCRFLFRKGVIDVVLYLQRVGRAGYYEMYKQGFVVSRQTYANVLKILERTGIVDRDVLDNRPPRTQYHLTEKGQRVATTLEQLNQILVS